MTPPPFRSGARRSRSCWPDSAQLSDIAVATPDRRRRGQAVLEPLVGMFVNTLVPISQTFSGETFTEFLHAVRASTSTRSGIQAPFRSVVGHWILFVPGPSRRSLVLLSFDPAASAAAADIDGRPGIQPGRAAGDSRATGPVGDRVDRGRRRPVVASA